MSIQIAAQYADRYLYLPAAAVEKDLAELDEARLKVLLYVFANAQRVLTDEELSQRLFLPPARVLAALEYWNDRGLVACSGLPEGNRVSPDPTPAPAPVTVREEPVVKEQPPTYRQEDIAAAVESSAELRHLLDLAGERFNKVLAPHEVAVLYKLCDWYGLSADAACMLVDHCAARGARRISYLEKKAESWQQAGITDAAAAEAYLLAEERRKTYAGLVRRVLGVYERKFTVSEEKHIARWEEAGYTEDALAAAYDKCVRATGKLSMTYMDKVLANPNGEASAPTSSRKRKPSSNDSFDLEEIEQYAFVDLSKIQSEN